MKLLKEISYGDHAAQKLDLYLPDGEGAFDLFLYFHGGGLTSGKKEWGDVMAQYLVRRGVAVASANYRMMPEHRYPAFIEDAARAADFMMSQIGQYGACRRIFLGGSSAGGYLSMMLCFDDQWLGAFGRKPTDIAGYLHDAGQPTAHFNVLAASGIDSRRVIVDETAPLYHIQAGKTYSPMHLIVSDDDLPGRYEQTMLLLRTLEIFGHTAPEVTYEVRHGKHCAYDGAVDEKGDSLLGQMVFSLIARV